MNEVKETQLTADYLFASPVYWISKPEYLKTTIKVADEYLSEAKNSRPKDDLMDKLYPVVMSNSFHEDKRVSALAQYIGETSWRILHEQGYAMENYELFFMDFWAQEHHMRSANEEHVHGFGAQITGFYILEAPEDCSRISIFDPRPAKRQINLPERDMSMVTYASHAANYVPQPGNLYFLNTWIPHGFTRHGSEKPLKFIHFNLGSRWIPTTPATTTETQPTAEII